jgi:hypothetical protein
VHTCRHTSGSRRRAAKAPRATRRYTTGTNTLHTAHSCRSTSGSRRGTDYSSRYTAGTNMSHTAHSCRRSPGSRRRVVASAYAPRSPAARSTPTAGAHRQHPRPRHRPLLIPAKHRIPTIHLPQNPLHKRRGSGLASHPVVHPLPLPQPLQQTRLAKNPQVSRYARLALAQRLGKIRNTQLLPRAQCEQSQPALLARRLQPPQHCFRICRHHIF